MKSVKIRERPFVLEALVFLERVRMLAQKGLKATEGPMGKTGEIYWTPSAMPSIRRYRRRWGWMGWDGEDEAGDLVSPLEVKNPPCAKMAPADENTGEIALSQ